MLFKGDPYINYMSQNQGQIKSIINDYNNKTWCLQEIDKL